MTVAMTGGAGGSLAMALLLAAIGPQAVAPALGTITGSDVRVSGTTSLDAAGRVELTAGDQIVLAGASAQIALARGGGMHLCGPVQLGLAAGGNGALLVSLAGGALEMRYAAEASDSVLTPDFRLSTIVPPGQMATVSASVALAPTGDLCVENRGSALELERLEGGGTQYIINGQTLVIHPGGGEQTAASCPCATGPPVVAAGRSGGTSAGDLFPGAPALVADGAPAPAPSTVAAAPATDRSNGKGFFLGRVWRWLFHRNG